MTPRRLLRIVSLAAPLLLAGCTAITDFSRFGFDEGLDHGLARDGGGGEGEFDLAGLVALPLPDIAVHSDDAGVVTAGVVTPSNGVRCPSTLLANLNFAPNAVYQINTTQAEITDPNNVVIATGKIDNTVAIFCTGMVSVPNTVTLAVKGNNSLAFVVTDSFYLSGSLILHGKRGEPGTGDAGDGAGGDGGPGGQRGANHGQSASSASGGADGAAVQVMSYKDGAAAAGGGGGGRLAGALGGPLPPANGASGGAPTATAAAGGPPLFGGGGGGGGGGDASSVHGGGGGGGGGAVQVSALGSGGRIFIDMTARLDVAGGGGGGGRQKNVNGGSSFGGWSYGAGGGGGGGGGLVWLEAAFVETAGLTTGCISAVGGGGGAGGYDDRRDGSAVRSDACPFTDVPVIVPNGATRTTGGSGAGDTPPLGTPSAGLPAVTFGGYGAGGGGGAPGWIVVHAAVAPLASRFFPQASFYFQPLP